MDGSSSSPPPLLHKILKKRFPKQNQRKRIFANEQIWTPSGKVRLTDEKGEQLGIFSLQDALQKAKESGLDLIKITEKVDPPVCKIIDYGKYLYRQSKKEKKTNIQKGGELKNIRLSFNISPHDLETRAKAAEKFLKKGNKVRMEMVLRGREKWLSDFSRGKVNQFISSLSKLIPINIERELKRESRGLTMIVSRGQKPEEKV